MPFARSPMDNPGQRQMLMDMILEGIREEVSERSKKDFQAVRDRLWRSFEKVDAAMTSIINEHGTNHDLTMWAAEIDARLNLGLQPLNQCLDHYGTPRWSTERFIEAEAFLEAALQAVQVTFALYDLSLNEVLAG